ncbi:MAG: aminoacyl-tRNA hydrolase, partial [Endomicrobium sp.]|nr:aminoacyl-tRNA hydrolase [Endomicrobium sp.]
SFYESLNYKRWLLKPTTFMNFSGIAVSNFVKYYKVNPEEIFVFCDDFSVSLGEYKIRTSGSSGGHNGINSIISYLKTNKFPRMKLGTGPIPKSSPISDFVLSKFTKKNKGKIELIKKTAVNIFNEINLVGLDKAVSKLANKNDYKKKQCHTKTVCAKGFVNGSCGGFVNGKCETDGTKDCFWVLIYKKLKNNEGFERFLNQYIEPKKIKGNINFDI